jgi:hypothetical protein
LYRYNTMFQLPVYDVTSSALREAAAELAASTIGVVVPPVLVQLPASLVAAFFASIVSQPGDTLLSTINKGSAGRVGTFLTTLIYKS